MLQLLQMFYHVQTQVPRMLLLLAHVDKCSTCHFMHTKLGPDPNFPRCRDDTQNKGISTILSNILSTIAQNGDGNSASHT